MASGSDVNGSTESFEMVIEEAAVDSATKQNSGKVLKIICKLRLIFLRFNFLLSHLDVICLFLLSIVDLFICIFWEAFLYI